MIHFLNSDSSDGDSVATFFLAQFTPEPFRRESRNVGIFVVKDGVVASRFVGERPSKQPLEDYHADWDPSTLRVFPNANVYKLWVDSWRRKAIRDSVEEAVLSGNDQFHIVDGGEVTATGNDSSVEICEFLYNSLISPKGWGAAIDRATEVSVPKLGNQLLSELRKIGIMKGRKGVPNPISTNQNIKGADSWHRVSVYQESFEECWAIESVDFTKSPAKAVSRAAYLHFAFDDLASVSHGGKQLNAVAVIKTNSESEQDSEESWMIDHLRRKCKIYNWANQDERKSFLNERETVAFSN